MRASLLLGGFACLFGIIGACAKGDALDSFEEDGDGGSGGRNTASKSSASGLNGPGPAQTSASSGTNNGPSSTSQASSVVSSTNGTTVASSSSSGVVMTDCDPENPGPGCGAAQHCVPQTSGDPTCEAAGAGTDYQLCPSGRSQCAPIYECVFDGLDQCCMRWCRVALDNCGGVEACTSFQTPVYIDGVEYGVCWDGYPCVI